MPATNNATIQRNALKEHLDYDPTTGMFIWLRANRKPWLTGTVAGRVGTNGYAYIKWRQKRHCAHRLAWEFENGPIQAGLEIDHMNGVRADNRISNLRLCTPSLNRANRPSAGNRTGHRGVSIHRKTGLYRARIPGTVKYFRTAEEAAQCYDAMVRAKYGEFAYSKLAREACTR